MDKKMEELLGRMKAAKTAEEVMAIAKEMPRIELSEESLSNVAGGTGRIELTEEQTERVVGGGHYIDLPGNEKIWIDLHENGYVPGTDKWLDAAYILEEMAMSGYFTMDVLIDFAYDLFGVKTIDIERGMRISGPAYVADGFHNAHGYSFTGY